jgi:Tol biopolymer transport system component
MSEDSPKLTAELVVDSAAPRQPVISPDGCWVVYVVVPVGRRGERSLSALWVAGADGSSPPEKLTAGTAMDSGPRWAPDSASLFFLSDRTGSVQLHRIGLDGREAEVLTNWHGEISGAWPLADARLVRDTGSWSAITSSTCSGVRAHGSTGGSVTRLLISTWTNLRDGRSRSAGQEIRQ